jgi:hypothetical protein
LINNDDDDDDDTTTTTNNNNNYYYYYNNEPMDWRAVEISQEPIIGQALPILNLEEAYRRKIRGPIVSHSRPVGPSDPNLTLIEFSDFPACAKRTMHALLSVEDRIEKDKEKEREERKWTAGVESIERQGGIEEAPATPQSSTLRVL